MKGDQAGSCRFSTRPTGAEGQTRIHRCRLTSVVQALTHDIDNLDEILCQRNRLSASYTSTPHRTASTRGTLSRPAARASRPPPTPYWYVLSWHCGVRDAEGTADDRSASSAPGPESSCAEAVTIKHSDASLWSGITSLPLPRLPGLFAAAGKGVGAAALPAHSTHIVTRRRDLSF